MLNLASRKLARNYYNKIQEANSSKVSVNTPQTTLTTSESSLSKVCRVISVYQIDLTLSEAFPSNMR
jgi:hypothetical protein